MWLPDDAERDPVPAILDAVPYRKGDGTAAGDPAWNRTSPGTGTRACGSTCAAAATPTASSGRVHRAGGARRRRGDRLARAQPWCTGAVGMIGVSWGGFAALQAAAATRRRCAGSSRSTRPTTATPTTCTTSAAACSPPTWSTGRRAWRRTRRSRRIRPSWGRAGATPGASASSGWSRGPRPGSPTSAATSTGARDPRASAMRRSRPGVRGRRLGGRLPRHGVAHGRARGAPVRGLIGPWGHRDRRRRAGPAIGFLQECVRFFDHALKGADNGFFDGPALVSYMQERSGRSRAPPSGLGAGSPTPAWPSPNVETLVLALEDGRRGVRGLQLCRAGGGRLVRRRRAGRRAGRPAPRGRCVDLLGLPALGERIELLGHAAAVLELTADRPVAFAAVAAVRRGAGRQLLADRARRAQPHPPRRP